MYSTMSDVISRSPVAFDLWVNSGSKIEVTHTYYDIPAFNPSLGFSQENLRSRVASVTLELSDDSDSLTYDVATHYTYDISGNVNSIIQEDKFIENIGQSLKRIDYDYDLVSGKVNYVYYQKDSVDQFIHHYEYDDDNRITHVYTSRDAMLWDEDAHYEYYLHGPLARTELGQHKVQGVDYAYTLQGWMKGINASIIDSTYDMGNDGKWPATGFSRDAYGFSLGYFYQDYKQIDPTVNFEADYTGDGSGSTFGTESFGGATNLGLYNGNIRHTVLSMDSMNYPNIGYVYQYDQLNRLKEMNAFAGLIPDSNDWTSDPVLDDYKELVDFDPNGNILKYLRRGTSTGGNSVDMDSLEYNYYASKNQLDYVTDKSANSSNYPADIDTGQVTGNYVYDANGNLIEDVAEGLTMSWWNNGKLSEVSKSSGDYLAFYYDGTGNRILKIFIDGITSQPTTTIYVRDAQGNILATYDWVNEDTMRLKEFDIYGSSRIGLLNEDTVVSCLSCTTAVSSDSASLYTGRKLYELTNHLGNVLSTITDKKIYYDADTDSIADFSIPEIASQQDYYPFGMPMPGRSLSLSNYRFGFNGQEKDNELKGEGNSICFTFRIYDPRLGKFLSIDPLTQNFPFYSPYLFSGDRVVDSYELEGLEPVPLSSDIEGVNGLPQHELDNMRQKTSQRTINRTTSKIQITTSNFIDGKTTVDITLGSRVKQSHVTDKTAIVIADRLKNSGNKSAKVTSAYRSPSQQAEAMYDNIRAKGVAYNKALYKEPGKNVVSTYEVFSPAQNCSKEECLDAMTNKIMEVGPENVSSHSSNPQVYNTIDIAPSSINNNAAFKAELKSNSENYQGGKNAPIKKYLAPPDDPAHHIEVPQKK